MTLLGCFKSHQDTGGRSNSHQDIGNAMKIIRIKMFRFFTIFPISWWLLQISPWSWWLLGCSKSHQDKKRHGEESSGLRRYSKNHQNNSIGFFTTSPISWRLIMSSSEYRRPGKNHQYKEYLVEIILENDFYIFCIQDNIVNRILTTSSLILMTFRMW